MLLWGFRRLPPLASAAAMGALLAVWMNLHGMYAVGYVWLGLQLAGALAEMALGRSLDRSGAIGRPVLAMALGTIGAVFHPFGSGILTYPFQYHFGRLMRENIIEWFPVDMNSAYGRFLLIAFAVTIIVLARAQAPATAWITTLALAYLAFTSRRNIPIFVLVVRPSSRKAWRAGSRRRARPPPPRAPVARSHAFSGGASTTSTPWHSNRHAPATGCCSWALSPSSSWW